MPGEKSTFKKNLFAGLLIIIPAGLTFFLLSFVIARIDQALIPQVMRGLQQIGVEAPEQVHIPGLGFGVLLVLIFIIGLVTTNFFGNKLFELGNKLLYRIPFVRTIYIAIKKIVDTFSLTDNPSFEKVVLLDYPREGLKGLGVVSCDAFGEIAQKFPNDMVCVFVPTTPNPTTGFTVVLPKEKVLKLNIPVDQGFKMIVSVGMYNPPGEVGTQEMKPRITEVLS